ncbi:MAG: hypothetical protein JWN88_1847 [Frankiales bacterium]|jgi:hypothetical protein|nr:hypothetical protein [Frankiales bacterium]
MIETEHGASELSRDACLALLPTVPFGRLVFTEGALPALLTVNFVLDPVGVVIRTTQGSRICRAANSSVVAFQADVIDPVRRSGWTVTVVGKATVVTDPLLVTRLAGLPLSTWVSGERNTFVVVDVGLVSGLRLGGAELAHDATSAV